jgi:hypothetical protein
MGAATERILADLEGISWLASVGQPIDRGDCLFVSSWDEAVTACQSRRKKGVALEVANRLREAIRAASKVRLQQWNKIVQAIRPKVVNLAKKKAQPYLKKHKLPKIVLDQLHWDILHWCMEQEYADLIPSGFYSQLGEIYLLQHFPCGWDGEYPEGKLLVY